MHRQRRGIHLNSAEPADAAQLSSGPHAPRVAPRRPAQSRLTVLFSRINFIKQSVRAPRPASARPAVPTAADRPIPLYPVTRRIARARRRTLTVIASRPFNSLCSGPFAVRIPTPAGKLRVIMTSKRKHERDNEVDRKLKRQRRRKRSRSEPLMNDSDSAEKRQALKRLFGRICSVELEAEHNDDLLENRGFDSHSFADENEDPLLDSVPVDMDPEQLGFLVCAQETLRFLHGRGIPIEHPVFARLRSRLLRGIGEMAVA
ncbi:unnamed protein product [Parnassius apollo]|uniref:(apollo) hypothetical protein n=1 Tax=Parnassius apollo TaxID=110799 RepID=A0A8S3XLY9_PARAO|nr:unnamed protein product [Parnassius apollo]